MDYHVNKTMEFLMESTTRQHHRTVLRALCMVSNFYDVEFCEVDTTISHQQSYYVHFRKIKQQAMAYSSFVSVLDILITPP